MDATTTTEAFGTFIEHNPNQKLEYTRKQIGKVLRATARFYEESADRWVKGFWRAKRDKNLFGSDDFVAAKGAIADRGANCYCLHGGCAEVAYQLGLPTNVHPAHGASRKPHPVLEHALNEAGLTIDWNDSSERTIGDVIRGLRDLAKKYR